MQIKNNNADANILDGSKFKIAVISSEYNDDIINRMQEASIKILKKNQVSEANIKTFKVPGAFEIPLACQRVAEKKAFDAIVVLGCVIKGETGHYYFVAGEASRGVMDVMLKFSIPIGFGIITTDNLEQAIKRSSGDSNKGAEATIAVLKMLKIF